MSDTPLALDRARAVARCLKRFRSACFNNLYIVSWDLRYLPAWQRGLQVFEGVPEVYPVAMALLEALGPGQRNEVEWMLDDWTPTFRRRVCDVAHIARDLIEETWGWRPGLDRAELDRLVVERKRIGLPSTQKRNAEWQEIIDSLSPEEWIEANMGHPPFHEQVEPAKREQFDRIVEAQLDRLREFAKFSFGPSDFSYWTSGKFANDTKWQVFTYLDDLDALEAEWNEPIKIDPRAEAELHDYEERPLIGRAAARVPIRTLRRLDEANYYLCKSIRAEQRRIAPSLTPPTTELVRVRPDPDPPKSVAPAGLSKTRTVDMNPGTKAIAAAYQLNKSGRPVSLKSACDLAGVDRKNVSRRYPDAVAAIKALAAPDREPVRGIRNSRTAEVDGVDWEDD